MKRFLLLLSAFALAGCVSLLPKQGPPPNLFVLEAGEVARADGPALPVVIGVAEPQGARVLLSNELVWRTGDQIAYVSGAQWSVNAQDSLQSLLMQTVSRQGRVLAAVRYGDARADYEVMWDVLAFEVDNASMQARFAADVTVIRISDGRVLASSQLDASEPVSARSQAAAAQSLTRAAREGSARIGAFVLDAVARDQTSAASINR